MSRKELRAEAKRLHEANIEISGPGIVSKKALEIVKSENAKKQVKALRKFISKASAA
jgi:hypothetical protein